MADEAPEAPPAEPDVPEPAPTSRGLAGLLARAKLLLFAAVVIVVECVIAYVYLPTAATNSALQAADTVPEPEPMELLETLENEPAPGAKQLEVDLGEYSVTAFQPRSNTTLRIDFHLYGTIDEEDREAFEEAIKVHQNRVRDRVIVTIRSSELSDLTDAGLGLIKRRILAKSNETFGKHLLQSVIFSDFSFLEQ
jgi:flagellar FliL protein